MMTSGPLRALLLSFLVLFAGALFAADTLVTTDGDTLVGKFEKLEAGEVYFNSGALGTIKVPVAKVASLELDGERDATLRVGDDIKQQQSGKLLTRDGKLIFRAGGNETTIENFAGVNGINETLPDERPIWEVSALGSFSLTAGNTNTYSLGYRFDIKRTSKHNFMTWYGRGSYFQDRNLEEDPVRERKHHFGYLYRYIFDFRLTLEVTEDLYFNEFAGYHYRSITGIGPGYQILNDPKLWWNVAAHLTYTYEDQMGGAEDRGYLGARARTELDWVGVNDTLHVNFRSEVLFDFDEFKNINVNNSLLVEYKFGGYFTAGLLVEHSFDNLPPLEFKKHDFRLTFTIGISWSGRWI
ncbi:MAG: DUF481 domain-containing protein [Planctomycetes bacterium]|nr:DUF481 domain-containing protein [Planctomycetota bacterium]